jgi:hypothetical protein
LVPDIIIDAGVHVLEIRSYLVLRVIFAYVINTEKLNSAVCSAQFFPAGYLLVEDVFYVFGLNAADRVFVVYDKF